MKVLIVEDERRLGEFLKQALTECRYTASWVRTRREAADALAQVTNEHAERDTPAHFCAVTPETR